MMFEKQLYVLAANVAKAGGASEAELAEIYRRYGDALYVKGDFQQAVQQYIKTIGTIQPSFVVRKVRIYTSLISTSSFCCCCC